MRHATTRMLFSYWDSLRGERSAPERGEIEPGAIRHILADTFILEIKPGNEAIFRLAGTRLCALMGGELKGKAFSALWDEPSRRDMSRLIAAVLDDAAGAVGGVTFTTESGHEAALEIVLLPLRHRGKTHSRILGALSLASVPLWVGVEPVTSGSIVSLRVIWPSGRSRPEARDMERRRHLVVYPGGRM